MLFERRRSVQTIIYIIRRIRFDMKKSIFNFHRYRRPRNQCTISGAHIVPHSWYKGNFDMCRKQRLESLDNRKTNEIRRMLHVDTELWCRYLHHCDIAEASLPPILPQAFRDWWKSHELTGVSVSHEACCWLTPIFQSGRPSTWWNCLQLSNFPVPYFTRICSGDTSHTLPTPIRLLESA